MGCFFMGGVCVGYCAAISRFWAASRAHFAQYRSTHLQGVGVGVRCIELVGGACHVNSCFKVGCLGPRTSDEYCAAILPVLGLDLASGVRYRSTHPGSGSGMPES